MLRVGSVRTARWNAANALRISAVDRTGWKGYILPLLFFKRISDVWGTAKAEAAEIFAGVDPTAFPEIHRFLVRGGGHWRDVREAFANVGVAT